ncbi:hypothetical protein BAY61_31945 (plasmid) [Prauserella marina]|uniref:Uncharacterized protein n=2 Tax=Prauserella marina TaxID=530584 RepID=A0A222W112_9PSEU|nr:hypothetical protein BAY61_31945 [Prauserella marina]SDD98579.1 hypothetical protein SAMN05421630_115167 [Prauserella marina]
MAVTQVGAKWIPMLLKTAEAGKVSYLTRDGRAHAAVVPVAVGRAYEEQAGLSDSVRAEIAAAVDRARTEITTVLARLDEEVCGHRLPAAADLPEDIPPRVGEPDVDVIISRENGDVEIVPAAETPRPDEESAPGATWVGADDPLLVTLQEQVCGRWGFQAIPWTRIQSAAEHRGVRLTSRAHLHRELRRILGDGAPEPIKQARSWCYVTIELWAAINAALTHHGQPLTYHRPYPAVQAFVDLLPAMLAACEGRDTAPRQDEIAGAIRAAAGVPVPATTASRLGWVAQHYHHHRCPWIDTLGGKPPRT